LFHFSGFTRSTFPQFVCGHLTRIVSVGGWGGDWGGSETISGGRITLDWPAWITSSMKVLQLGQRSSGFFARARATAGRSAGGSMDRSGGCIK
jgi:hypothetical protein